ncbi:MAG: tRNA 2-selenouridine(34) synthase MnmH [Spirochaetales bacterium]|nr:tRNA 2-selenouridine(34) synthase MnmH [Spirochaetales bacterium]
MSKVIPIDIFLNEDKSLPIIDVRSPLEYKKGHIPGAINIPLFSNRERADVGICYKKEGKDRAVELGLEIVGPKLSQFVKDVKKLGSESVKVYCARGGMRSSSFCWLMDTAGFKNVYRLEKGYKAFRNYALDYFEKEFNLKVISGMTGSGKTDILLEMEKQGEQVLDLEGFANHRGSAFGGIGKEPEASTEAYENKIFSKLFSFDLNKPIWIEDESRNVGKVLVPPSIFKKMETSFRIIVEVPIEVRAERLAKDYTGYGNETILESLNIIQKRLSERYPQIVQFINERKYKEAALLILPYYDKSYTKGIQRRPPENCTTIKVIKDEPSITAKKIKEIVNG